MDEKYKTDEKGRLFHCLHCGAKNELVEDSGAKYCIYCGYSLINQCINFGECGSFLPPNAAYCPYCGCESHFLKSGLTKSKRKNSFPYISDDELPF